MSELQSRVKSCINCTEAFLASLPKNEEGDIDSFVSNTYQRFLQYTWHDLPVSNADGSALATVSCMPLWELLNEYTSTCKRLTTCKKRVSTQILTAMYPKSKDRRCTLQQLNCCGNSPQTAVPLTTHIPIEASLPDIPANDVRREYVNTVREITKIARSGSYIDGKETTAISALLRSYVNTILPKCVLVDSRSSQSASNSTEIRIQLQDAGNAWNSGFFFLLSVWSFLLVGEYLGIAESKELAAFLRTSRWSSQTVSVRGQRMSYTRLLSPLTDVSALCVSLNLRSPSTSVDTVPLVDPRVVQLLCGSGCKGSNVNCIDSLASPYEEDAIVESKASLAEKKADHVEEQLDETIPNEIDFMGFSSTCRDFDQLAYLCRDLLFLPSAKYSRSTNGIPERNRDLLFNRKRGRGGNDSDGPCFIPVKSSLSHVMEKGSAESQVALERLCRKWKKSDGG